MPGVRRPAIAVTIPSRRGRAVFCSTRAQTRTPGPRTSSSSRTWVPSSREEILDVRESRGPAALDRRGAREGKPAHARGARAARGQRPQLRRQHRGPRPAGGSADVVVTDGFTGNVALKLLEGTIKDAARRVPGGDHGDAARQARRPADPAGCATAPDRLDPDTYGGAYLLGLRGLAVIAHGNSSRPCDRRTRSGSPPAASSTASVARLAERGRGAPC